MAAVLFHEPVFSTQIESGDKLYFYEVGTTTDLTVYTDFALTAAATQPVVADSDGRFVPLYIDATGNDPKVVLADSSDVEKWTCDRYPVDDLTQLQIDLDAAEAAIIVNQGAIATAEADIDALELESVDYETRITALEGASTGLFESDFTGDNQSLVTNGFQYLPGGLLMQWGKTGSLPSSSSSGTDISFPEPFPNSCLNVIANEETSGFPSNASNWGGCPAAIKNTTQFTIYPARGKTASYFWQAIGY